MSWSVATATGEAGTIPAVVAGPCIIEFGRIIATVSDLEVAQKAAAAVNALEAIAELARYETSEGIEFVTIDDLNEAIAQDLKAP